MRTFFDIECNNFYFETTEMHCISTKNQKDGNLLWVGKQGFKDCLEYLNKQDEIIAHNGIAFDIPVMIKLAKLQLNIDWAPTAKVIDTLVMSRVIYPHLFEVDMKYQQIPQQYRGSHSVEAWGMRTGVFKKGYEGGFETYNDEMGKYCQQDVEALEAIFNYLNAQNLDPKCFELEHKIAKLCSDMVITGFKFDIDKANNLYAELSAKRDAIQKEMAILFPDRVIKRVSERTGKPLKDKIIPFNPGSRDQISANLIEKYNWKPKEFTPSGKPEINEEVLLALPYPEAQALAEYFQLQKILAMLAEGDAAWLKLEKDGWLHGGINPNGAVTGRATHRAPNMAQIPSGRTKYGKGIRSMFTVPKGYKLLGVDMSGLELRGLGHFLARFDDGVYANEVVNGDIHWTNAQAFGFIPQGTIKDESIEEHKKARKNAKLGIYCLVYGGGDAKMGETCGTDKAGGKKLKERFFKAVPAYQKLRDAVTKAVDTRGYLFGLDGRKLHARSAYAALNTLIQSAGAVLCKQWIIMWHEEAEKRGWKYGKDKDFAMCAWVHDECQIMVREEIAEEFAKMVQECNVKSGEHFDLKCPIAGDAKIGINWEETH